MEKNHENLMTHEKKTHIKLCTDYTHYQVQDHMNFLSFTMMNGMNIACFYTDRYLCWISIEVFGCPNFYEIGQRSTLWDICRVSLVFALITINFKNGYLISNSLSGKWRKPSYAGLFMGRKKQEG